MFNRGVHRARCCAHSGRFVATKTPTSGVAAPWGLARAALHQVLAGQLSEAHSKSTPKLKTVFHLVTAGVSKSTRFLRDHRSRGETLTGKAIQQETLEVLVRDQALRELRAIRMEGGWCLEGRIALQWRPVRSRRESIRVWRSLTALERFCTSVGIKRLTVEL